MCFKIIYDFSRVDLNFVFDKIKRFGPFVLSRDILIVFINEEANCDEFKNEMMELLGTGMYIKEIKREDVNSEEDFFKTWISNYFNEKDRIIFERKHQKELKKMQKNIKLANKLIRERINKIKEVNANGGKTNGREEKTR